MRSPSSSPTSSTRSKGSSAFLRAEDALNATLMLGDIRMSLRQKIINPLLQSQTSAVTLEAIWLDLTLERIGYILFGEVNNVILADISLETLPTAIDVIRSMILSVRAKGQGTWQLEECDAELGGHQAIGRSQFLHHLLGGRTHQCGDWGHHR